MKEVLASRRRTSSREPSASGDSFRHEDEDILRVVRLWMDEVGSRVHACTPELRAAFLAPVTPKGIHRLRAAKKYIAEHKLLAWVSMQNGKALAPSGPSAYAMLRSIRHQLDEGAAHATLPAPTTSAMRKTWTQWLRRWRTRQGLRKSKFKCGPGLSRAELQRKAKPHVSMLVPQVYTYIL